MSIYVFGYKRLPRGGGAGVECQPELENLAQPCGKRGANSGK
jgi:hypothetical protein